MLSSRIPSLHSHKWHRNPPLSISSIVLFMYTCRCLVCHSLWYSIFNGNVWYWWVSYRQERIYDMGWIFNHPTSPIFSIFIFPLHILVAVSGKVTIYSTTWVLISLWCCLMNCDKFNTWRSFQYYLTNCVTQGIVCSCVMSIFCVMVHSLGKNFSRTRFWDIW